MQSTLALLLQPDQLEGPLRGLLSGPILFCWAIWAILVLIGGWKMFEKAGQPGWAILIPIYNVYILLKIAGRPGWWLILYLIPLVNIIIGIVVAIDVAKAFGQSALFGFFLLFLLLGLGYLILGFGNYRYIGPQTAAPTRP